MKPTTVHSMIEYRHETMIAVTTSVKSTETGTGKTTCLSTMVKESPVINLNLNLDLETGHHLHAPAVEVGVETTPENDLVAGSKTEDPPVGGETEDPLVGDETKPKEGPLDLTILSAVRGETRARDDLALPVLSARRDRRHHNHLLILLFPKLASRGSYTDLTKEYLATDVVSVRLCDFSSDDQAKIGQSFTPSSQGMINVKHDVPFIFKRVERDYGVGWVAHCFGGRGLKRAHWIPKSEHAKYLGVASDDDSSGSRGNGSPHEQMKVRRTPGARFLENISHVFAGELVKVTFPRKPYYWGRLKLWDFHRLCCLSDFLTAAPGSSAANEVPPTMDFDHGALKELRTADDSLPKWMRDHLATLDALHNPKPSEDDKDADARLPRGPTAPNGRVPRPTMRQDARDVNTTAPPPAITQATEEATQPRDQPRQPPTRTTNAPRDPRPQPPTGPRLKRSRDGDDPLVPPNTTRRRRDY
ncbi:uncharacterized protein J4E87_008888 [Alternaria ethzedia]|uniref:uncharacterized protein n=1 Tax=Alternaria ethzedia TaxID=181014 RepID=UPI0020C2CA14|nr:uncharacterized protein J4E87_008888 [Alternaria ethzedia]KAI4616153.1 hypothetical protein J4E87_008888 [Alternaria ethzedia]